MPQNKKQTLAEAYSTFLCDLDGTIYHGNEPIASAVQVINSLYQRYQFGYLTNNASTKPQDVARKLQSLGVPTDENHVISSPEVAAALLAERYEKDASVAIIGSPALFEAIAQAGFTNTHTQSLNSLLPDRCDVVVQGINFDTRWHDLAQAAVAIRRGAGWIVTNYDPTLPSDRGPLPGNGSLVRCIELAVAPIKPLIAGKPAPAMIREALHRFSAAPGTTIMIGDRIDTDICAAHNAGIASMLVETGVNGPGTVIFGTDNCVPNYIAQDFTALTQPIELSAVAPKPGWECNYDPQSNQMTLAHNAANGNPRDGVLHTVAHISLVPQDLRPTLTVIGTDPQSLEAAKLIHSSPR